MEEKLIKTKVFKKKKKKRKAGRKKRHLQEHSDGEWMTYKKTITQTSVSVFDLIASEKIPCQAPTQRSKTPQSRPTVEKKSDITTKLSEVQAKLYALKNRLWFGVGQGDSPISWGSTSTQKSSKKNQKKTTKLTEKTVKVSKVITEKTGTKLKNGIKRKQVLSWPAATGKSLALRKSRSLPDTTAYLCERMKDINFNTDQPLRADKKKKKKKGAFSKKAKAVSNAMIFVTPQ